MPTDKPDIDLRNKFREGIALAGLFTVFQGADYLDADFASGLWKIFVFIRKYKLTVQKILRDCVDYNPVFENFCPVHGFANSGQNFALKRAYISIF